VCAVKTNFPTKVGRVAWRPWCPVSIATGPSIRSASARDNPFKRPITPSPRTTTFVTTSRMPSHVRIATRSRPRSRGPPCLAKSSALRRIAGTWSSPRGLASQRTSPTYASVTSALSRLPALVSNVAIASHSIFRVLVGPRDHMQAPACEGGPEVAQPLRRSRIMADKWRGHVAHGRRCRYAKCF
jgi:hypothetical protein